MFNVPDLEWEKVVPIDHQKDMICWECYVFMRSVQNIDGVSKKKAFNGMLSRHKRMTFILDMYEKQTENVE